MSKTIKVVSSGRARRTRMRQEQRKSPFYNLIRTKKKRSKRKKS